MDGSRGRGCLSLHAACVSYCGSGPPCPAARRQRVLALLLLLGGAIGQVDVLNTFCHAHTPVLLSLLRVVNGLWLGVIAGVIAIALCFRAPKGVPKTTGKA